MYHPIQIWGGNAGVPGIFLAGPPASKFSGSESASGGRMIVAQHVSGWGSDARRETSPGGAAEILLVQAIQESGQIYSALAY
jgi:hypothetical protein